VVDARAAARQGRPSRVRATPLAALAPLLGHDDLSALGALGDLSVTGTTHDSRRVLPGDLYVGLPGAHSHGASFARQAAADGAVAMMTDTLGAGIAAGAGLPVVVVDDPRARLGAVAAAVYGDPSRQLSVLGVTGTNGKTTTAYLLEAGLRAAGQTTGLIGTVETRVAGERLASVRTTPEAPDLQALLALMVERGVQTVAMEVSSHALALGRVDGTHFRAGLFTNLSQDHLDFHGSMAEYLAAKASLFRPERCALAVLDDDDADGRRLAAQVRATGEVPVVTVGRAGSWQVRGRGPEFTLISPQGEEIRAGVGLLGEFNVANAALALVALLETGTHRAAAVRGVAGLRGVPGRVEPIEAGQDFLAVVDYAHTPDAVALLLQTLRPLTRGRLVAVLGCGGDRDRGKRPLMGAAAARYADLAVLTDDNPRSESSEAILAAMLAGAQEVPAGERAEILVEPDRGAAIALAVARARAGDTVALLGKGHETGQEVHGRILPFDDRSVLRDALGACAQPGGAR